MKYLKLFENYSHPILDSIFAKIKEKADIDFIKLIKTDFEKAGFKFDIFVSTNLIQGNENYKNSIYLNIIKYIDGDFEDQDFMVAAREAEFSGRNIFWYGLSSFEKLLKKIENNELFYRIYLDVDKYDHDYCDISRNVLEEIGKQTPIEIMKQEYGNRITIRRNKNGKKSVISADNPIDDLTRKWYKNYNGY